MWVLVPIDAAEDYTTYSNEEGGRFVSDNPLFPSGYAVPGHDYNEDLYIHRNADTEALFNASIIRIVLQNASLFYEYDGPEIGDVMSYIYVDDLTIEIDSLTSIPIAAYIPNFSTATRLHISLPYVVALTYYTGPPVISEIYYWSEPTAFWTNKVRTTEESIT